MDPPYGKVDYVKLIDEMMELDLLNTGGTIYCEHDPTEKLPNEQTGLSLVKQENYGGTIGITIYRT